MGKERPLDYVPIHTSIRRHRKTRRLERALGEFHGRAHWYVIELFLELADEYPDGVLPSGFEPIDIADAAGWDGDPGVFVDAMTNAGWLEHRGDGSWCLVNWVEYGGKVLQRRTKDRIRKREDDDGIPAEPDGIPDQNDVSGGIPAEPCGEVETPHIVESRELRDCSIVLGGARDLPMGALQKRLEQEYGYKRGLIRSKWIPLVSSMAPFSQAEIDQSFAEAKAEHEPNAGLLISILNRNRETPAAKPKARAPPREQSAFRQVTEELLRDWVTDGSNKIPRAYDEVAGLLPAASGGPTALESDGGEVLGGAADHAARGADGGDR